MKKGLGKGINALLGGVNTAGQARESKTEVKAETPDKAPEPVATTGSLMVDIRKVEPNPTQPRQYFEESALEELAESLKTFGIVQPLLVRNDGGDNYTIIAGERRYRAARMANLKEVPVIIKEYTEMEVLQVALLENIQRQDLTAIEEANCYKRLMDDFFFSVDDIATKLGKKKHAIIATLHLLELGPIAQELAAEGKLTPSHAKVLLGLEDAELQGKCANQIVEEGLSVRAAEAMVAMVLKAKEKAETDGNTPVVENAKAETVATYAYRQAEDELKRLIGTQVRIRPGKKSSKIEIEYYSNADLDRILDIFKGL